MYLTVRIKMFGFLVSIGFNGGTIKSNENIDNVFRKAKNQLDCAGITQAIPGIKRAKDEDKKIIK